MVELQITGDHEVHQLLVELSARFKNLSPVMRKIGGIMHDAVEENFEQEGRPKWKPLAASTIRQRTREGKWPGKILQKSQAGLAPSISERTGPDFAAVGTDKTYGRIQNLGGQAGRGGEVPIPARPFLKLTNKDRGDVKMELLQYLLKSHSK